MNITVIPFVQEMKDGTTRVVMFFNGFETMEDAEGYARDFLRGTVIGSLDPENEVMH